MAPVADTPTTERLVAQLAAELTSGISVLVTGLPRSGRSHLLQAIAGVLAREGANVVIGRGNRALADRPLAAFSLLALPPDDKKPLPGGSTLARAAGTLDSLLARPDSVLVIDDADGLDQVSIGVIAGVRTARPVPLLIASTMGCPPGGHLAELIAAAQPGVTARLGGLSFEDITQMANARLGGVAAGDTVSRIATLSGGLPGVIEAIIRVGRQSGRLVEDGGVWVAPGDLWDDSLQFALTVLVRDLGPDELDALTVLAGEPGLPRPAAENLIGRSQLRRFLQQGLVFLDHVPAPPGVHVFPPVLARWLRADDGAPEPPGDRHKIPATDLGYWPAQLTGAAAAAAADRLRAGWAAEVARLWDDWTADRRTETAVPLLAALFSGSAGDDRIDAVMERTVPGQDEWSVTLFQVLRATYKAVWGHDLAGALADLEDLERTKPGHRTYLRGIRTHLIIMCDRAPAADLMELGPGDNPAQADILLATRAETLIAQGRVGDAAAILADLDPASPRVAIVVRTLQALVKVLGDDVDGGIELAVSRLRAAVSGSDMMSLSGYAYVAALGMAMRGRFAELESIVEVIHRLGDTNVFQNYYKSGLLLLGAFIADWEGRRGYALNLSLQAKSLGIGIGPFPGMLANHDLLFRSSMTAEQLWDEVDDVMERGYVASAVYLGVAAAELDPGSDRSGALLENALVSQSPVLAALARYIQAALEGDPAVFPAVVDELREACGRLDAIRATITWALALRARGDHAGWLDRAAAAWREASQLGRPPDGLFDRLTRAVDLTPREAEVADHVAGGMSSPEIAHRLGVSTRTIETYLHSVYRKAGVATREELREIAGTWLVLRGWGP